MFFIRYEDHCANPRLDLERFYSYLGLPYYGNHDFNHVEQITVEDDEGCLVIIGSGVRCSPNPAVPLRFWPNLIRLDPPTLSRFYERSY